MSGRNYVSQLNYTVLGEVSILARSDERAQPIAQVIDNNVLLFQSSPARMSGRNRILPDGRAEVAVFQSSPARMSGRNKRFYKNKPENLSFNPRPLG